MNTDYTPATLPGASAAPLTLRLVPPPTAWAYAATVEWENYANGDYQLSTIRKEVRLLVQANQAGYVLDFQGSSPELTELQDPEPLAEMALRLSALYAHVVVQAAPTGAVQALLNHEELLQAWERLAPQLRATTTAADALTGTILDFLEQQLHSPASVLRSLPRDYLYQALVPDWYARPLTGPAAPVRERQFASFFDGASLWFTEQVEAPAPAPAAPRTLRLRGTLDRQKTDLAAVQQAMWATLRQAPAAGPLPATLPEPHFCYEATYVLDAPTALPLHVALRVYARAGELYNKEYNLTLNRL